MLELAPKEELGLAPEWVLGLVPELELGLAPELELGLALVVGQAQGLLVQVLEQEQEEEQELAPAGVLELALLVLERVQKEAQTPDQVLVLELVDQKVLPKKACLQVVKLGSPWKETVQVRLQK